MSDDKQKIETLTARVEELEGLIDSCLDADQMDKEEYQETLALKNEKIQRLESINKALILDIEELEELKALRDMKKNGEI